MRESRDIWFNAFLLYSGVIMEGFDVDSRKKVTCRFRLDDAEWTKLKMEFQKSDIAKFKGYLDQIKDLGY